MKTTSLFQFGGIAVLFATALFSIGNLMYILSGGQPTTLGHWISILGSCSMVLGLVALFARQVQAQGERGGTVLVLGLIGFVLLVLGNIATVGIGAVGLGVTAGAITNAQVAQVPSYTLVDTMLFWVYSAGQILFGISIYLAYRAQEFRRYAGALLVLVSLIQLFTGLLPFLTQPIYAILSLVAWGWLGWMLVAGKSMFPQPQERVEHATAA